VKRFVAVLMLAAGLVVAGGAKAAVIPGSTFDCTFGAADAHTITGNVGDTYTVTESPGFFGNCTGPTYTVAGVVTNNPATLQRNSQITFTLAAPGTTVATLTKQFSPNQDVLTFIVNGPTAKAIPSLSEWAQLLLGLMVLTMIGWHFHRERSY
jgi:hypothetical protein